MATDVGEIEHLLLLLDAIEYPLNTKQLLDTATEGIVQHVAKSTKSCEERGHDGDVTGASRKSSLGIDGKNACSVLAVSRSLHQPISR